MTAITFASQWQVLAARIRGLEKAALVHASFLNGNSQSPYGADKSLQSECEKIRQSVESFYKFFRSDLPESARTAIEEFQTTTGLQIQQNNQNSDALLSRSLVVKVIAFESELSYCLSDSSEKVRSASELAFLHLQRLIAVDPDYRAKWIDAYSNGEVHCEKLGGLHLLWHAIWAFKVDSSGARTDLIYQEKEGATKLPVALGIILTEWKLSRSKPEEAFEQARKQADLYVGGPLAGAELASHRYLVVVTDKQVLTPPDVVVSDVTYRHINIAVNPRTPSAAAKG